MEPSLTQAFQHPRHAISAAAEASFVRRRDWVKVPQEQRIFDFPDQAADVSPGVISAMNS